MTLQGLRGWVGVVGALAAAACGPSAGREDDGAHEETTSVDDGTDGTASTAGSGMTSASTGTDVTTSSGGSGSTTLSTEGQDTGQIFVNPTPDGGGQFRCDLFAQDCLPGTKCMPWASDGGQQWNQTRCSPVAAEPRQIGEACMVEESPYSGIDDCDVGLMCWHVGEDGVGTCEDMCTGSPDEPACAAQDDACAITNAGNLVLCVPRCDPLVPTCSAADACYPAESAWACLPDASGRAGTTGDICDYVNQCDPGYACAAPRWVASCEPAPGWDGCCAALCDLEDPLSDAMCAAADPAYFCRAWYGDPAPAGYAHVGVCALPR